MTDPSMGKVAVNQELLELYWHIWTSVIKYMRAFAQVWPDEPIVQQAAAQIPWSHDCVVLEKVKGPSERVSTFDKRSSTAGAGTFSRDH